MPMLKAPSFSQYTPGYIPAPKVTLETYFPKKLLINHQPEEKCRNCLYILTDSRNKDRPISHPNITNCPQCFAKRRPEIVKKHCYCDQCEYFGGLLNCPYCNMNMIPLELVKLYILVHANQFSRGDITPSVNTHVENMIKKNHLMWYTWLCIIRTSEIKAKINLSFMDWTIGCPVNIEWLC